MEAGAGICPGTRSSPGTEVFLFAGAETELPISAEQEYNKKQSRKSVSESNIDGAFENKMGRAG